MPPGIEIPKPKFLSVEIGYRELGHGLKGRKVWLHTDGDLQKMSEKHYGKKSIQLWCYSHTVAAKSLKEASN